VDTPGFKSSSVSFESAFKSALSGQSFAAKKTREKHIDFKSQSLEATVTTNTGTSNGLDGNNVDIDYENAELAKNTIYYNTLIEQVSSEFRKLSSAINNVE
jgi:flagellar basal-body rod protein FlgB